MYGVTFMQSTYFVKIVTYGGLKTCLRRELRCRG